MNDITSSKAKGVYDRMTVYAVKLMITLGYGSFFVYALFFARRRRHLTSHYLNLQPIKGTIDNFIKIDTTSKSELFNFYSNLFGNIFLFLPLPILLALLFHIRDYKRTMIISFILSVSTEVLQYVFKRGVADVDDVLLNLTGAFIGCFLYRSIIEKLIKRMMPLSSALIV